MFGRTMAFDVGDFGIRMRAFNNAEEYVESNMGWNSQNIMRYMDLGPYGSSDPDEKARFETIREGKRSLYWAIEHIEDEKIIGYTQFFGLDPFSRTARSSIMIWNEKYWNQKITSHVHKARTYYGAKILNLAAMKSYVHTQNQASFKSLQKVGYEKFGTLKSFYFIEGKYLDAHHLVWYNPSEASTLFPDGVPKETQKQLDRAKKALEKAEDMIIFP